MSIREWQFKPVRCGIRQTLDAVSCEVVILSLLPVSDNRRARGLELLDRVPDGFFIKRLYTRMRTAVPRTSEPAGFIVSILGAIILLLL